MKRRVAAISAVMLLTTPALATPRLDLIGTTGITGPSFGQTHALCKHRACHRVGGLRFYQPYGYYRPFHDDSYVGLDPLY